METKTNVLLLTVDDMNCDSVGCFRNPMKGITPNIDKLALEGMRFENSHVTIAVCQPSRSVLLTGRYPHHNGARGFQDIDCSVTTLPQVLHNYGYLNAIIGKETHVSPPEQFCWDIYVRTIDKEFGFGRDPEVYYQESLNVFARAKEEKRPFFAMINSHDPHRPFAGSEDELNYFGCNTEISQAYNPDEVYVPDCLPDLPDVRRELSQYYASVHRADMSIGRILDAMQDAGVSDNTIVLFLSDNGMALPYAKTNCYLNSTKSPYIMKWSKHIAPNSTCNALVSGIDYTPTILDLLGIEPIVDCDGKSMKETLFMDRECHEDIFTLFYQTANNHITKRARNFPMRCVQDKRFAYIFNGWSDGETVFVNESTEGLSFKAMESAGEKDELIKNRVDFFKYRVTEELYDYKLDPHALNNLITKPEYRDILRNLRKKMFNYMKETKDGLVDNYYQKVIAKNK